MEFIAITFKSAPNVRFAHVFETHKQESYKILAHKTLIEITVIERGALSFKQLKSGETKVFEEGDIYTTPHYGHFVETVGNYHRHTTIGLMPDEVSGILSAKEVLEFASEVANTQQLVAVLPIIFRESTSSSIAQQIKKTVDVFNSYDIFKTLKSTTLLMDVLSYSTTKSFEMAQKEVLGIKRYNHPLYSQQAMQYIAAHINDPLDVEVIAETLNVSYGHLSRLFKQQTGLTLVEYINREKVRKMEELLLTKKHSVSEIAQSVGISDEKYASRLFHKYTGLTISSYIKLYKK